MSQDLHGQIMNMRLVIPPDASVWSNYGYAYKVGHRDARHAAAELALKSDAEHEAMLAALRKAAVMLAGASVHFPGLDSGGQVYEAVSAAIAKATGPEGAR